jgi:hypothetical protein
MQNLSWITNRPNYKETSYTSVVYYLNAKYISMMTLLVVTGALNGKSYEIFKALMD